MSTPLPPPDDSAPGIEPLPYPGAQPVRPVTPVPLSAPPPPSGLVTGEPAEEAAVEVAVLAEEGEFHPDQLVHLPAVSGEAMDLPTIDTDKHNKEKAAAVALAVLVHVALALLLGVLVVVVPGPPASEITAIAAPASQEQSPTTKKIAEPPPPQSVSQLTTSMKFVTAASTSAVPMPNVEFDPAATTLDLGTTLGNFDANFSSTGAGSVVMFGKELKNVRKIAVVMDVSRSMTRYLPEVVKEMKKIGRDSALVLYFGCWMNPIDTNKLEKVYPVGGVEFDKFWQYWQGRMDMQQVMKDYKNLKYDPKLPMPLEDVYKQVAKRKETYFIDRDGSATSVYSALMAKEIRDADAIYWFADFMDRINDDMLADFVKKMKSRQRKLYIHAPHNRGPSLDKITEQAVKPLGGEAIILDIKV